MVERLQGILTFKAPVYREVAEDTSATTTAAVILVVVNAIVGFVNGLAFAIGQGVEPVGTIVGAILWVVFQIFAALVGWVIFSYLSSIVAKSLFEGKTDPGEMLRVFGFANIFSIIGIIPCLGLIAPILAIVATVIGIREAGEFSTGKAIGTAVIAGIAAMIAYIIIMIIPAFIFGMIFGLSGVQPTPQ
jgi:hypothetical protein